MENSFPFVRPACVCLGSRGHRRITSRHDLSAPATLPHRAVVRITPEGGFAVIVITARWAAALGIPSRARPVACASGAETLRSAVHVGNRLYRSLSGVSVQVPPTVVAKG